MGKEKSVQPITEHWEVDGHKEKKLRPPPSQLDILILNGSYFQT